MPEEAPSARGTLARAFRRIRSKVATALDADPRFFTCHVSADPGGSRPRPMLLRHGRGPGGSSALYSAALGRFRRSDFEDTRPARLAASALPNDWPIDYDAFRACYVRAEELMRVRGERDPTDPDDDAALLPPPPLMPGAEAVRDAVARNGYHPYRLHVAVDYVAGCAECFGFRCPRDCKSDGSNRSLRRALRTGRVTLETERTVERIAVEDGVVRVTVRDPEGRESERRAGRVVLAAGALNTPLLLERSTALWRETPRPAMLSRGLMFHLSDVFALAAPAAGAPRKWLALRDLYADGEANLGEIQSTGTVVTTSSLMQGLRHFAARLLGGHALVAIEFLRPAAWLAARRIGPLPVYASIVEDMPFAGNRVEEKDGRIVVIYAADPELTAHLGRMRDRIRGIFRPFEVRFLIGAALPNWGHPMGTCRMGRDPETSVTEPSGRLRGHPEVYVADASAFPSSGGAGPSLTVVAFALHVADRIAEELRPSEEAGLVPAASWTRRVDADAPPS